MPSSVTRFVAESLSSMFIQRMSTHILL
jgi:hypothetical protein